MSLSLAALYDGNPGRLRLERIPTPEPGPGEVVVEILACTICGSDLHTFEGRRTVPVPTILGHEILGRIAAFGPEAPRLDWNGQSLSLGDRVVWAIVASCGTCPNCTRDLPQKCETGVKFGHEATRPGRELLGGFASHCLLPRGSALVKVPDALSAEAACPAGCATATVAGAIEAAGDLKGKVVVVAGAGMLGLTACAWAHADGASEVICLETRPERRDRAMDFGATRAIDPADLETLVADLNEGRGVDVFFELSGANASFLNVFPRMRLGGTILLIGSVFPGEAVPLRLEQVVRRQLTIQGLHNYAPRHLARAVAFLETMAGRFPFESLVVEWHPLTEIDMAFARAADPNRVRVGVRPF